MDTGIGDDFNKEKLVPVNICYVEEVRMLSEKLMLKPLFFNCRGISIKINPLCSIYLLLYKI